MQQNNKGLQLLFDVSAARLVKAGLSSKISLNKSEIAVDRRDCANHHITNNNNRKRIE